MKTVLLVCGGGGTEHEVSLVSSKYIKECLLKMANINVLWVEICKDQVWRTQDRTECELRKNAELFISKNENGKKSEEKIEIHYAIPCIHGPPGETGDIQSVFELMGLSYLGPGPEASRLCFNKISTKLWLSALGVPNTPYDFLNGLSELNKARDFMQVHGPVFIKASSQGSSVGCYPVHTKDELEAAIKDAFKYSPYVLIEKMVKARELEISVYEHKGEVKTSVPGEIIVPSKFYSYTEKYSSDSHTSTEIKAKNLDHDVIEKMRAYAKTAFVGLKLRHLSRIDFFLTHDGLIYLNEINTFPGMTPISMFPKMMEGMGDAFQSFLEEHVKKALN